MGLNFNKDIETVIGVTRVDREQKRVIRGDRVTSIKRKTILSGYGIAPKFHDFRDYYIQYILYLPFCSSIVLETPKILGRVLSIDCYLDIRTAQGKYYIMSDNCLIATASFECRVNMPITSTNPVQQALDKTQGIIDTAQGVGGVLKGAFNSSLLGKALGGGGNIGDNVSGALSSSSSTGSLMEYAFSKSLTDNARNKNDIIGGVGKTALGLFEMFKPSPISVNGGASGSTCVEDPLNIYLYTLIPDIHYNEPLKQNYGLPNNIYDKLGNHKGYVEINDIKLTGTIPSGYKADIMQMLQNGIYIK